MTKLRSGSSIVAFVFFCVPTTRVVGELTPRKPPPKPVTIAKPAGGPACPDPAGLYEQCPSFGDNGEEGLRFTYSDVGADRSAADNFTPQGEASIRRIRWWGTYLLFGSDVGGPVQKDDFTVLVWRDADGNPSGGDPVSIPGYTVIRAIQPVGQILNGLGPDPVYEYDLTFEEGGFPVEAGTTYWLEVRNDQTDFAPVFWVWVTAPSPPGDGNSRQRSPATDPDWNAPTDRGFDLAFSLLSGPPEPIPCASQWGLIALTLLLLAAGTIVLRHRCLPLARGERS